MTKHAKRWALALACFLLVVSGCSTQSDTTSGASTAELPAFPAADRFVECMADKGWKFTRDIAGLHVDGVPEEQDQQFYADDEECAESSGLARAQDPTGWTADQKRELYDREVQNHDCLLAIGRPSEEPPSFETYLELLASDQKYMAINAYNEEMASLAEYEEAVRQCPPPLWFNTMEGF